MMIELAQRRTCRPKHALERKRIAWGRVNRAAVAYFGLAMFMAGPAAAVTDAAVALVKGTTEDLIYSISEPDSAVREDKRQLYALVDGKVAPLFDFERFSKIISGKYWRKTSAAQREQLQAGVRTRLVRTIATGLNNYSDQHIRFLPSREGAKPGRTTVRMEIRQSNGGVINLGYRLYQESGQWRIYDVILDGISMAKTYRTQMASHVGRKGMDSFIAVLGK